MKTEQGIHTFSLSLQSTYSEVQNIREQPLSMVVKQDKYALNTTVQILDFKPIGVEIQLHQSLSHRSWIRLIINPSSLLRQEYCPTELFSATEKKVAKVERKLQSILSVLGLADRAKQLKLSRIDLTENHVYASKAALKRQLEYFRKSYLNRHYRVVPFGSDTQSDTKYRGANDHAWTIESGSCAFSVYDKTYELEKRHKVKIDGLVLRQELRLKRKRIVKLAGKGHWNEQLCAVYEQRQDILAQFLHRLQQDFAEILDQKEVLQRIEDSSFRKKTRTVMKQLVKKTARCVSLTEAKKKLKLSGQRFYSLLKKFRKLGVSPITR